MFKALSRKSKTGNDYEAATEAWRIEKARRAAEVERDTHIARYFFQR